MKMCNVSPAASNYESLNALSFATRARKMKTKTKTNQKQKQNKPVVIKSRDPTFVVIDGLRSSLYIADYFLYMYIFLIFQ